jgi:hypothetical protein
MGMDWHSSGITTSVLGALKRGLRPIEDELGIWVCGGRGRHSRKTPDELAAVGERTGLDGKDLAAKSRLAAKVDGACVQDGFELYLHGFFVTREGSWSVVQQGMNGEAKLARRYHWLSEDLESFVEEPHAAIEGKPLGEIVNLTDARARASRTAQVELIKEGPDLVVTELAKIERANAKSSQTVLPFPPVPDRGAGHAPRLRMPMRHQVVAKDVVLKRLHASLAAAHARGPVDFADLVATPGLGARTLLSLAMVAEVLHGAPSRFADPARFSLAHGGKDGHPYPVPLRVYDETIRVMKNAVERAKIGSPDRLAALKRLDDEARRLERADKLSGPSFDAVLAEERARSHAYGGMTVFGAASSPITESREPRLPSSLRRTARS